MSDFEKRYTQLNTNQRKAVDTIDGPVMVIAGPGTGKTELLSMRVANILDKTDVLPHNILCLTFTESGATAMRERLSGLLGPDAFKVAIHTFHSFGTEIINQYGEYFYSGAHFRPADELSTYETLVPILERLPHGNPIGGKMNGAFTHLRDIQSAISDLKKSGLTPDELGAILDRNDAFAAWIAPRLKTALDGRLSKKSFAALETLLHDIQDYRDDTPLDLITYTPLAQVVGDHLQLALDQARADDSTKPLSAWKRTFIEKNAHDEPVLKDAKRSEKLRALANVYYDYLVAMQERSLYDFDDMILRVVHALEVFHDLRLNLQEQYQYILVDEFQDTNDAQMRLLWNLTNNDVMAGRPNIMVVGDDDQAIYRFQGAKVSNILDFESRYRDVAVITLTDNYRSSRDILSVARSVIVQGQERLERTMSGVDKTLTAHHLPATSRVDFRQYGTELEEFSSLAERLAAAIADNPHASRAIIARHHKQLVALLPHLQQRGIHLRYERQEDILETEPVQQLELVARIFHDIAAQAYPEADELMPQLLAHPAWRVSADELWQLSLRAYRERSFWLEAMLQTPGRLKDIAEWIIVGAHYAQHETLEFMLDYIFGVEGTQAADSSADETAEPFSDGPREDFVSPLRAHFFPVGSLDAEPERYIAHLHALRKLRQTLREYRPDAPLELADFVHCIDLHRELGIPIQGGGEVDGYEDAVTLLTAHRSKGLEFDEVYVINACDNIWGESARGRARLIAFPHNLPLAPAGEDSDERLRLLYVALTRAKAHLYVSLCTQNSNGRNQLPVGALSGADIALQTADPASPAALLDALSADWRAPLYDVDHVTAKNILGPILEKYRISATHFNNFLDVTRGGPQLFLLQNLLRFPQAMGPDAAYGSSIHTALQRAHTHLSATGQRRPVEDVLHDFEEALTGHQLSEADTHKLLARGSDALNAFLAARYDNFSPLQIAERSFATDAVKIGDACLTGAIDLLDVDLETREITVTDYKTGRAIRSWQGKTDIEKLKLHHYRRQLMIYKLLIEGSRQFSGHTVTRGVIEFVEPDARGEIVRLELSYDPDELATTRQLIEAVWREIQALNFTLPEDIDASYKGVLAFEKALLATE